MANPLLRYSICNTAAIGDSAVAPSDANNSITGLLVIAQEGIDNIGGNAMFIISGPTWLLFDGSISSGDIGKPVYISESSIGLASLTVPILGNSFQLGILTKVGTGEVGALLGWIPNLNPIPTTPAA